jgi:hypothetical protein
MTDIRQRNPVLSERVTLYGIMLLALVVLGRWIANCPTWHGEAVAVHCAEKGRLQVRRISNSSPFSYPTRDIHD